MQQNLKVLKVFKNKFSYKTLEFYPAISSWFLDFFWFSDFLRFFMNGRTENKIIKLKIFMQILLKSFLVPLVWRVNPLWVEKYYLIYLNKLEILKI